MKSYGVSIEISEFVFKRKKSVCLMCLINVGESKAFSLSVHCDNKVRKHFSLLILPFCSILLFRMAGVPSPLLG